MLPMAEKDDVLRLIEAASFFCPNRTKKLIAKSRANAAKSTTAGVQKNNIWLLNFWVNK
jgi:hypothetical protein